MAGLLSIRVSGNWHVVFRFEGCEAVGVDLWTTTETRKATTMAMLNPFHPGEPCAAIWRRPG